MKRYFYPRLHVAQSTLHHERVMEAKKVIPVQLNRPLNCNQNPRQDIAGSVPNRTPPGVPSIISDRQRVRLGAGMRHASLRIEIPATIADAGKIRLGAGMRRM